MLTNKWILLVAQVANAVLLTLAHYQWSDVVSAQTATQIGLIISIILAALAVIMPPASQPTIVATGGKFFSHT